ncbi:MAG TPA: FMN-binding negative transcriptional regulator [Gammaproteobacteria bacterium]|nr:FMN-binding negative transcriptional regulator [Gammaproteobacteria bacterium]
MYLKPLFEETEIERLHELAKAHPLATFVTLMESEIVVNHMPVLISADGGKYGTLRGHIPRENPLWRALDGTGEAVTVFQGPEAYISPSWYPSKRVHGKVVPTWNYVVVHARGMPTAVDDADWIRNHLNELTDEHESREPQPWSVSDAPKEFVDQMIGHVVGIEMPIASIVGKWKLSQNRPVEDQHGVVAGLRARGDEASLEIGRLIADRLNQTR